MKYLQFTLLLFTIIIWSSCRKDFDTITNNGNLEFSKDTVFFDTIFTRVKSSTQQFKIFNRSNEDITIPSITLERGINSRYQLNVNGFPQEGEEITPSTGKEFTDIDILARDSIFVFLEVVVDVDVDELDDENNYDDRIIFEGTENTQSVELITNVTDATFIFQEETDIEKSFLTTNRDENGDFVSLSAFNLTQAELNMTNERAYVIFGNAVVPSGETLTIDAGARLHFHEDSSLFVEPGANIIINGEESPEEDPLLNEVIIEGDRIAADFDNLPGQWGFIWIQNGSTGNSFTNTTIKNASLSLLVDGNGNETTSALTLKNVQIYNSQSAGIQANATFIEAENLAINQSGQASLNIEQGGTYNFNHCTLVNYFGFGFRSLTAVTLSNSLGFDSNVTNTNLNATFTNCIIAGNNRNELTLRNNNEAEFNFKFENSLIFVNEFLNNGTDLEYDFDNPNLYENCVFNEEPEFRNTNLSQLEINEESAANGIAQITATTTDILGIIRDTTLPDAGAYESSIFDEEEVIE